MYKCVAREKYSGVRFLGYRYYWPTGKSHLAPKQAQTYQTWILKLKDGDERAERMFAKLLQAIWRPVLWMPDVIIPVPGHEKTTSMRKTPLGKVIREAVRHGCGIDGSPILRRAQTIDSAVENPKVRNVRIQKQSMEVVDDLPPLAQRILLLDDVGVTWRTMRAAVELLREAFPERSITAFAFGRTPLRVPNEWPEEPVFPGKSLSGDKIKTFCQNKWGGDGHDRATDGRFVINKWNRMLHRADCPTVKQMGKRPRYCSRSEAIRDATQACGTCMPLAIRPVYFVARSGTVHSVDCSCFKRDTADPDRYVGSLDEARDSHRRRCSRCCR